MNIQEQEEMDFWPDTEERNLAAISWMNNTLDERILSELNKGKFVVVIDGPFYCKYTDALLGTKRIFHCSCDSISFANICANELIDNLNSGELIVKILG